MRHTKLVIGCGYLGRRVARRWRDGGDQAFVVTRSHRRGAEFEREGLLPIVADVTDLASLVGKLPAADTVLFAVGYDRRADKPIEAVYVAGLRHVLDALPAATGRIVYVSSTGVYGDAAGEWIDEDTPCRPSRPGGIASFEAERVLAGHRLGAQSIVLRLAGLYGPGRIPRADAIRRGEPIAAAQDGFLNLIHVDDAVEVVAAAARTAMDVYPTRYVVSDGHPVVRREYYQELARLLGAPSPRFVPAEATSLAAARAAEDKRVSNRRMLAELGITLRHPTYRQGLAQIVAAEGIDPQKSK
ncbi:MAG TPA: NAD-dependent epimerase/dehydratase family protein [Pirellulales bacterium]|nr:NAD-dependent epimerase/dehydratase family protein [Pirellulales bacterium]